MESQPVPPTTTVEEDLKTAGQRSINRIWEFTQATIAIMITGATIYSAVTGKESAVISNAFTLIATLYFIRTNHTRVGGKSDPDSR